MNNDAWCRKQLRQQAKQDYATGNYHWFDLKQKYNLPIDEIMGLIEEVRNCSIESDKPNRTTKG